MGTVTYNRVEEFAEELAKDAAAQLVDRRIVRVTNLYRNAVFSDPSERKTVVPWIKRVYLLATYDLPSRGDVVRVEQYIGEVWHEGPQEQNEQVWAHSDVLLAAHDVAA